MKHMLSRGFLLLQILILISLLASAFLLETKAAPSQSTQKGVLDLDNWHDYDSLRALSGQWLFYPGLLSQDIKPDSEYLIKNVPHFWEVDSQLDRSPYGFGTYTLTVTGLSPHGIYSLSIPDEVTAYKLTVNNVLVTSNGIVSKSPEEYVPQWRHALGAFQADSNGTAEFVMEIANFEYYRGGFWNSIKIGSVAAIFSEANRQNLFDMLLFSSISIIGLYNFVLFFVYKRRDATVLFFSLFCFCMSLRTLLIGQRLISYVLPALNWYVLIRLEYLLGYLLLPLFILFAIGLLKTFPYQRILKCICISMLVFFTALCLILPNVVYTSFLEPYKYAAILYVIYFAFCVIKYMKRETSTITVMLVSAAGFVIAIIKEVFFGGVVSWMPYATMNLIICFSLLTFRHFFSLIRENEVLGVRARRDPLTGLYNRHYLMETGQSMMHMNHWQKRYLMFLDLDDYKIINDSFGHKIGDYILCEVGGRLKNLLRDVDCICRYGGDEFVIIIGNDNSSTDYQDIEKIAERLILKIGEPIIKDGHRFTIGASIGIAEVDNQSISIDAVIKRGDEAMYTAKRNGGSQYYVWQPQAAL